MSIAIKVAQHLGAGRGLKLLGEAEVPSHALVAQHLGAGRGLKPVRAQQLQADYGRPASRCWARIETTRMEHFTPRARSPSI